MLWNNSLFAAALCAALTLPVVAQETRDASATRTNLVETAANAGNFKTLLTAAKAAGLADLLSNEGPFTLFAPNDDAFAALPDGTLEALLKDRDKLADILRYHVVPGVIPASAVKDRKWLQTAEGQSLLVQVSDDGVTVDGAKVVQADIRAKNGIIHVIDKVITPRMDIVDLAMGAGTFGTLCKCVSEAGLVETLKSEGPFTVFAPNDAAFAKIPAEQLEALQKDPAKLKAVLTYHVVAGRVLASDIPVSKEGKPSAEPATVAGAKLTIVRDAEGHVTVNGVRVIKTDIIAGNGVIHVLEGVVMPK